MIRELEKCLLLDVRSYSENRSRFPADDTVFPESLANVIGVDLTDAPTGVGSGVGLISVPLRYA